MSTTDIGVVANNIQKYWSPRFTKELRARLLLGSLVNREYEGEIKQGGDSVYVTQINKIAGQTRTIGTDADTFETTQISTERITIQANKRFVAAAEATDIVALQSQIDIEGSEVREALMYGMMEQINKYIYGLVSASTSSPDHSLASCTDCNASQLAALRVLAGQAKWGKSKPWYGLVDPVYYMDIGDDTTLSSSEFNGGDPVYVAGEVASKRLGFNIVEDDSLEADHGLFFHPDFLHFVMQNMMQVKISDLHSQKKFGVMISVDSIGGGALGNDGDVKHIQLYNSSWAPHG